jgi:hypothetical protein
MSNPLNLYATKVFAEHPVALWALDETVDFLSLIDSAPQFFGDERDENLSTWDVVGATVVDAYNDASFLQQPEESIFPNVPTNGVIGNIGNQNFISFNSTFSIEESDIDPDLGSIAIGSYFYFFNIPIVDTEEVPVNIAIGYVYEDPDTLEDIQNIKSTSISVPDSWAFISETFDLPDSFSNLRVVFEISYGGDEDYQFAINGISLGQWAEEFHAQSLGSIPETLPNFEDKIIPVGVPGIEAFSYGLQDRKAYYLSSDNKMLAKNAGLPLVYGAFNSTDIVPSSEGYPGLIVQGMGILNKSGQYRNLTLEFWMKIKSKSLVSRRICGPIASTDGIYVEGPFVKLKIGQYSGAHYVGEWDRPMLVDLKLGYSSASLILNGDEVIQLNVNPLLVNYPDSENETESLDWIGFYAYHDVPSFQIDAVGIYPYEVPAILAKRRWVYGQGVEFPNNVQGLDNSNTIAIDYAFANHAKNHSYPKIASWQNGISDNLRTEELYITSPQYDKPRFYFNNKTEAQWYIDAGTDQIGGSESIKLRPSSSWSNTNGYLVFPSLNFLREETKAFYGIFRLAEEPESRQTLFELHNELNNSSIEIYHLDTEIFYVFKYVDSAGNIQEEVLETLTGQIEDYETMVGIDLDTASRYFGNRVGSFFGSKSPIKVYVGGKRDFSDCFSGEILSVNFSTYRNLLPIRRAFSSKGILVDAFNEYLGSELYNAGDSYFGNDGSFWNQLIDGGVVDSFPDYYTVKSYISSYKLNAFFDMGIFKVDIGASSYWEDYMPLSYFEKYITDSGGNSYQDLDFLQLNVDYPKMKNFFGDLYNTDGALVKTYVSFQNLRLGVNATREYDVSVQYLNKNNIVQPGEEWLNVNNKTITKYEVLNETIIYPPVGVNLKEVAIFFHVEIQTKGIESNPVKLRSLHVSSIALNQFPNRIGTRFGATVLPYRKYGLFQEYKQNNPYAIYRGSTPYLYLSSTSGVALRGDYSISSARYLEVGINQNAATFYRVGAMQMSFRYDEPNFPLTPVEIFEIESNDSFIKFYLIADNLNQKRGQVYAVDALTGGQKSGIVFYMDGKVVKRPVVKSGYWSMLGMSFGEPLDFASNALGALRITSPIRFDNVSHYQVTAEDEITQNTFRKWSAVAADKTGTLEWDYWANTESTDPDPFNPGSFLKEFQWSDVLFFGGQRTVSTLDAEDIYKKYAGTSRVVIDSGNDLLLGNYRYNAYTDLNWSQSVVNSV